MRFACAWVVAGLVLSGCAGGQRPWSGSTYCEAEAPQGLPPEGDDAWVALLLRGFDPRERTLTYPAVDCTGTQVRWEAPAFQCADNAVARTALPHRPLEPADVVVTQVSDRLALAWVVTDRFASGDALGPAAVVERRGRHLQVNVVGHLRAFPTRATLRLERMGEQVVLAAEGERCASADPASCERAVRLMPLSADRFLPATVVDDDGQCLSASLLHLTRTETERLESGWIRQFELTAALAFGPDGLAVQELMLVRDRDPRQPAVAPRLFRRAESAYTVRAAGDRLVAGEKSLWTRVRYAR